MSNGVFNVPFPVYEPILDYAPGSPERQEVMGELRRMGGRTIEIPARIGGRKVRTGRMAKAVVPHDHQHVLATWHRCGKREVDRAIQAALAQEDEMAGRTGDFTTCHLDPGGLGGYLLL